MTASTLVPRFVLITVLAVVLPMSIVGAWASQAAARSGRVLLRAQLSRDLEGIADELRARWQEKRTTLVAFGESEPVRRALVANATPADVAITPFVRSTLDGLGAFDEIVVHDRNDAVRLRFTDDAPAVTGRSVGPVSIWVPMSSMLTDLVSGRSMGSAYASVRVASLLPALSELGRQSGPVLAIRTLDGRLVTQGDVDAALFDDESTTWAGRSWSTVSIAVPETGLTLLLAGDLAPYRLPFTSTAQRSTFALLVTAGIGVMIVLVLTRRLTRGVERDFAQRDALASVGEFASELAHEVRNPLGAMRLDLQRAQELVDDPDEVAIILPRVLALVSRLENAVSGALRVTRGRTDDAVPVHVMEVLARACDSAQPEFTKRRASLRVIHGTPDAQVVGDAGALEQLFLNLLLNAAQALDGGGEVTIRVDRHGHTIRVRIVDTGRGMSDERLAEIEQPYRSSRRDGTGLGVKISRRIAVHHGGTLHFESRHGEGTTVEVQLPSSRG